MFISWLDHHKLNGRPGQAFRSITPHHSPVAALARGLHVLETVAPTLREMGIDPAHVVVRVEREACR